MRSLHTRLFLTYFFIIGVTLGLTALSLFLLLGGYRDSITYGNLEDLATVIDAQANAEIRNALLLREQGPPGPEVPQGADLLFVLRQLLSRGEDRAVGEASIAIVDREGRVIPGGWRGPPEIELDGAQVDHLPAPPTEPGERNPRRCKMTVPGAQTMLCVGVPLSATVLTAFPGTDAAALIVAEPATGLGEVVGDLMPRLLFSGMLGVAAALVLGYIFSQSIASTLANISRAARSVARGNYRQRVPVTGPREIRNLASDFNRMTEEVQRSQQTLRDFLANISHELKTPLTSIRGFSDAILDGTIDDSRGIENSARIINAESNRVLRLVEELLDLSRIESGQISMRQEDLDLAELFQHVGDVFSRRAEEAAIALELDASGHRHIRGDFDRLEQVLNNLLDNAFRYTAPNGRIRLASRDVRPGVIQVSVSDTGPGINPEELQHLFDRFYRGTNGARASGKGYGLGLAISREIVRAHGGDIWVTSERGHGTTFVFTLPSAGRATTKAGAR